MNLNTEALIRVISLVSNDIVTDNRVHKIAASLEANGFMLMVVGREFSHSKKLITRSYTIKRFRLWFNKGPLFYANLNIRFFFFLLRADVDIILSNDLDTLPAGWLAAKLRRKKLVFDSHELFPEVPELVRRPVVRSIWLLIERILIKRISYGSTVSDAIANHYNNKYNKPFVVIRNVGRFHNDTDFEGIIKDDDKKTIIYQGALNVGRGLELAIQSMMHVENIRLQIIGDGNIREKLEKLVSDLGLDNKVEFVGRIPLEELWEYTAKAHLGISLEEDLGLNYQFALPNKLFDYIQARIPVVVSDLKELSAMVDRYAIGKILTDRTPDKLGEVFTIMLEDELTKGVYYTNLEIAARELCWEREEEKLIELFKRVSTLA